MPIDYSKFDIEDDSDGGQSDWAFCGLRDMILDLQYCLMAASEIGRLTQILFLHFCLSQHPKVYCIMSLKNWVFF